MSGQEFALIWKRVEESLSKGEELNNTEDMPFYKDVAWACDISAEPNALDECLVSVIEAELYAENYALAERLNDYRKTLFPETTRIPDVENMTEMRFQIFMESKNY